ncbi:hypothetical protein MLD38_019957 [Melastoma candidum]|uniref:Uncharacterized protein n=1 Tax=Melastoma candidum TaxID=119954 RepID=A0ACB9QBZ2_9MYRT|nr:hypothetical protein MLD38_019957 [Melastoma candidum]
MAMEELVKGFGSSKELVRSASYALEGRMEPVSLKGLSAFFEAAHQVASCAYEDDTDWGKEIGWMYGSTSEDILTGINIHRKGWRSVYCTPDPPAFMGCAPNGGPAAMTQMKRWVTGHLEILVSRKSPVYATLFGKLQFRLCLAYVWVLVWALRSIPEITYALLPAYCIITNSHFLPKVNEPAMVIPTLIFVTYNIFTLFEYFQVGLSVRAWWNNHRMQRVTSACAWFFGVLGVVLKLLGVSQTVFEVTRKESSAPGEGEKVPDGKFTFDNSPLFISGTTLVLVELTALVMMVLGLRPQAHGGSGTGIGEVICAVWVLLCFSIFVRGLLEKKGGIPLPTVFKSAALATLFVHFSIFTSRA